MHDSHKIDTELARLALDVIISPLRDIIHSIYTITREPGHVAQSVTPLAADESLTADPGVASLI